MADRRRHRHGQHLAGGDALARQGHDVTLLFTGWHGARRREQKRALAPALRRPRRAARGRARAWHLDQIKNPHFPARSAYEVYAWLRRRAAVRRRPPAREHGPRRVCAAGEGAGRGVRDDDLRDRHARPGASTLGRGGQPRRALTREEFLVERGARAHSALRARRRCSGPSRYLHDYMRLHGWTPPRRAHACSRTRSRPRSARARRLREHRRRALTAERKKKKRSSSFGTAGDAQGRRDASATRSTCSPTTRDAAVVRRHLPRADRLRSSAAPPTTTSAAARRAGRGSRASSATATSRARPSTSRGRACWL